MQVQEKESLDHQTKKILIQEMLDQQEAIERIRGHNLQLINEPAEYRKPLYEFKLEKNPQKVKLFIAFFLKMAADSGQGSGSGASNSVNDGIIDSRREQILQEIDNVYMKDDTKKIAEAISHVSFSSRNQDFIVEVCCKLHQIYEEFSALLIQSIIKVYKEPQNTRAQNYVLYREFNRKRYILRILTELYLKGLFQHYKDMFTCMNELILITKTDQQSFLNAIMVLTDYFKTYGE